jgi:alpha-N-acetylglucosamine transferase
MKNVKLTTCVLLLSLSLTMIQAQQNIMAFSDNASRNSEMMRYVATANDAPHKPVALDIHRVLEISVIAETKNAQDIVLQSIVYPNPPSNFVILKTGGIETEDLMYLIQDTNGRVLKSHRIQNDEENIGLENLAPATYFLIVSNDRVSKKFKIVKN